MTERRSRLGLDEDHSIWHKLSLFFTTLLLGPLIGLMLLAGISVLQPPWQSVATVLLEALAVFWFATLIFIWWRPPWFRRVYLWAENKLILVVWIMIAGAIIVIVFGLA